MTLNQSKSPSPDAPDLSREQVVDIYKQAGDAELRRHIPLMMTDGKGFIGFLCGCGQTYSHDAWWLHIQTRVNRATKR